MKYIFILFAFLTINAAAQIELKHGLTADWGKGFMSGLQHNISEDIYDEYGYKLKGIAYNYNYNASLGYRFRFKQSNSKLFYDADITLGIKKYSCEMVFVPTNNSVQGTPFPLILGAYYAYNVSLSLSCSYILYKNFYAGIGIAPYYRYRTDVTMPPLPKKLDVPVFARIGYDFRFIDVAFAYKFGLTDMMQDKVFTAGRINDWQLQVFVPF